MALTVRASTFSKIKRGLFSVWSSRLCTPGMGVNLWGVQPRLIRRKVDKSPVREPKGVHDYGYYQKY